MSSLPQINVGTISHRHGTNFYAARTFEGLLKQIAAYVRENWNDRPPSAPDNHADLTNYLDLIDAYFDGNESEFVEYNLAELFD
jgi:hypothetical protein